MKIVVDSREQNQFTFVGYDVEAIPGSLPTGDYSLPGCESLVAVERKSLDDLVGCLMGSNRDRFERELSRAGGMECFAVVVESSWQDLAAGNYRSKMKPHAACQSILAFQVRYRVPFLFMGSRRAAEYATYSLLTKFAAEAHKRLSAIKAALNGSQVIPDAKTPENAA